MFMGFQKVVYPSQTNYSLLLVWHTVVSSTISVTNGTKSNQLKTFLNTFNAMVFKISFCISGEVYLSDFFIKLASSSPRNWSNCMKFELDSLPCPRRGVPCRARKFTLDRTFSRHFLFYIFSSSCSRDKVTLIFFVVAGKITVFNTGSLWHWLHRCLSNFVLANFLLEKQLVTNHTFDFVDHCNFFSTLALVQIWQMTLSLPSL